MVLKDKQQWKKALEIIRAEIKDPQNSNATNLSDINILGIHGLGNVAKYYGYTPEMDAEAKEYFRVALKAAGDDVKRKAQVYNVLYAYYAKSTRNGLAIPLLIAELNLWQELNNTYQILLNYGECVWRYGRERSARLLS